MTETPATPTTPHYYVEDPRFASSYRASTPRAVNDARARFHNARDAFDVAIFAARAGGEPWSSIAATAMMTRQGAALAAKRGRHEVIQALIYRNDDGLPRYAMPIYRNDDGLPRYAMPMSTADVDARRPGRMAVRGYLESLPDDQLWAATPASLRAFGYDW